MMVAATLQRHRKLTIALGVIALFGAGALGGHWLAARLDAIDTERSARDVLEEMKRERAAAPESREPARPAEPTPRYARIDDLPDLPKYTEVEPGKPRQPVVERARPVPAPQVAAAASSDRTWRRNAVALRDLHSRPLVTIVIDDVGLDRARSKRAWELPGPLTLAFLPYAKDLREQTRAARARGHELMVHLPMEPSGRNDPGPNALLTSLADSEIRARTAAALDSFEGHVGFNNHMGSRFTAFRPGMDTTLRQAQARGLMFLDSRTTPQSVGEAAARDLGVPALVRHVFLDDEDSLEAVRRQLRLVERLAREQGFVVAIGHPHEATLQALAEWLPMAAHRGLTLAPATAALRKRYGWD